jgi:hypothetical protein
MVNKKGQIKIQQMAFMLIAVFILFVLIGMVVLSSKISEIKKSATELDEKNALTLVSRIANSPEFSCERSYGNQESDCVDLDKVFALKKNVENYNDFWGVSNIEIRKVFPVPEREIECTENNYPECNYINLINKDISGFSVSNFVSVCYKERNVNVVANKCDIGQIILSYEVTE